MMHAASQVAGVTTAGEETGAASLHWLGEAAFRDFYDRTARRLWAYLAAASGDRLLADDLTQEAFIRLLHAAIPPEGPAPAPDAAARIDLRRLLARLPPRERQILWLAHVEGGSHAEIAAITGLGPASIRVLLFPARRGLAGLLRAAGLAPKEKP